MKSGTLIAILCACIIAGATARAKDGPCPIKIEWKRISDLPQAVGGPAFGWLGRGLIVAGGTYWIEEKDKVWSAEAYRLGREEKSWTVIPPIPIKTAYPCLATFHDTIYIFGGQSADKTNNAETWKLSSFGGSYRWETFVPLPEKLANMQVALIGSTVFLVAGDAGTPPAPNNHMWKIDLASRQPVWTACAPLPGPLRVGVATAAARRKIYAFGGGVAEAYRYEPRADRWERIADLPWPAQWAWAVAYRDRYLIMPGGFIAAEKLAGMMPGTKVDPNGFLSETLVFDSQTQKYWRSDPLPAGIIDYGLARVGDRIYLAGGEDRGRHRQSWLLMGRLSLRQ